MANTLPAYCSKQDIYSVLSEQGVNWAADDNQTGYADDDENTFITDCMERAQVRINQYIHTVYVLTSVPGNTWMKWCCAVLSAVQLLRRRGGTVPDSLTIEESEYIDFLKSVQINEALVPPDSSSDMILLNQNAGMTMTNLHRDQRFRAAQIRYISRLSTTPFNSKLPRSPDYTSQLFNN